MLQPVPAPSAQAQRAFDRLDQKVSLAFANVVGWRGWRYLNTSSVPVGSKLALIKAIADAMAVCQAETDTAAFRMIGPLSKAEGLSIHDLLRRRSVNDGFGLVLPDDLVKSDCAIRTGFNLVRSTSLFVTTAVWEQLAEREDPVAYLGAEHVSRQVVGLLRQLAESLMPNRDHSPAKGSSNSAPPCSSDFYRDLILRVLTLKPSHEAAILRGASLMSAVFPLMVWDEVFSRCVLETDDLAA